MANPRPEGGCRPLGTPRAVLVMRYRYIGDTLLAIPLLRNLRQALPDSRIDILLSADSFDLLRDCPYVDGWLLHRERFWETVGHLRRGRYDAAFILKRSWSSAMMAGLAGIPRRIGHNTEGRGWLLTDRVPYPPARHERDCYLDLLEAVDIPILDRQLEAWFSPADAALAEARLPPTDTHWAFHATSTNVGKQWPTAYWSDLVSRLLSEDPSRQLHAFGTERDRPVYDALCQPLSAAQRARVHLWCGQTSLTETLAMLARMQRVVGVDSGLLHMASALGVPVLALFGPMDERRWAPLSAGGGTVVSHGLPCRPCHLAKPCGIGFECMTGLSVDAVWAQSQSLTT